MTRKTSIVAVFTFLLALPATSFAQGYLSDFTADFDAVSQKLVDLAEAVPAESYSWQPAEGIRSVSEVYMHIAIANYFLASIFDVPPPEGFSPDLEKTTTAKADVIAALKESQEHVKKATMNAAEMNLEEQREVFGAMRSLRAVFMIIASHSHEHLGQSIAYARSNDITPPWSAGN